MYSTISVPVHGHRPIFNFTLKNVGKNKIDVPIGSLLDSGSSIAMLSYSLVWNYKIPKIKRYVPLEIHDYAGNVVHGAGSYFSFPMLLNFNYHNTRRIELVSVKKTTMLLRGGSSNIVLETGMQVK
jgi:hypothetical protein